jgi:integrase
MARKGLSTTADYLPFDELKKLFEGLHRDKLYKWEAYCKVSYCTAFRISDVRTTTWKDILHQSELIKMEQKTKKSRLITFSQEIADNIAQIYELAGSPDLSLSVICNPHTRQPYSREYINRRLKYFQVRYQIKIRHFSTHSFRKTFARNTFEANGGTMKALSLIQKILNHKNPQTTLIYMGYVQDDINEIYNSLHF